MEASYLLAGLVIGGSLGTIAGGLFAGGRAQEKIERLEMRAAADDQLLRKQGRELAEHRADKQRRIARRAKTKQTATYAQCHAELRQRVGEPQ